ncbi:MAG: SDR family oxidoreductase [Pseudomonadota bacterium]|nr:SDR family oxidoreductase [Pseudomonadota bacterium]
MNVFITGASSGIGAALAAAYARDGAVNLGLFARRADVLAGVVASLPAAARIATYVGDVRDPSALNSAAAQFMSRFGVADTVFANAGISQGADTAIAEDLAVFRRVLETNVLGMVHTFHPFIAGMRAAGHGRLVGIASMAGVRGLPGGGAYSASKAAAINYLESLRVEMRGSGVRVVTIVPGYIATPMTDGNPYRMPFRMNADAAAKLIVKAVAQGRSWYVLPWQMALAARALRHLPRPVFDALFAHAPRKPRSSHGS